MLSTLALILFIAIMYVYHSYAISNISNIGYAFTILSKSNVDKPYTTISFQNFYNTTYNYQYHFLKNYLRYNN
jgi:hypothetical protein